MSDRRAIVPVMIVMTLVLSLVAFSVAAKGSIHPGARTQAQAAAEAGLAWAHQTLVTTARWDDLLSTAGRDGVAIATDVAVPGAGSGRYTVMVRNDGRPGDDVLTGVAIDPGGHTTDTNGHVVVDVTGTVGGTRRTVSAVIRRIVMPPIPAAVSFPGSDAQAFFAGDGWVIDGSDVQINGNPGTCAPRYGIAVATPASEIAVENAVFTDQKGNVRGRTPSTPDGSGDGAIATEPSLTPSAVAAFVRDVGRIADVKARATVHAPATFAEIGTSCATEWGSPTCWGTPERPKIVHVKGETDAMSGVAALQLTGSVTGHGILIVEDGDLRVNGTLDWTGLIVVSGQFIGVGFLGGAQTVNGAIIANETGSGPGLSEGLVLSGNATIRYSCEALDLARSVPRLTTMVRTDATAASRHVAQARGDRAAVTVTASNVRMEADGDNGSGELQGQARWTDTNAPVVQGTLQILLEGSAPATRDRRYLVRGRLNDSYRVPGIVPGEYRLLAQVGMTRLWDRKVSVKHGASTSLDLTD